MLYVLSPFTPLTPTSEDTYQEATAPGRRVQGSYCMASINTFNANIGGYLRKYTSALQHPYA